MDRRKAEVVEFQPDIDKVISAVTFVIHMSDRHGYDFTQYDIVKTLFLADRFHLNRFGRPISWDNYVAMVHGPVPSLAYDLLKEAPYVLRRYGIDRLPWSRRDAGHGKYIYLDADVVFVDEFLSPSDMSAIEDAAVTVSSLSFGQIRKLTHEDAAYIDAWEDDPDRKQFPMSLALMFDAPNFEKARELRDLSRI